MFRPRRFVSVSLHSRGHIAPGYARTQLNPNLEELLVKSGVSLCLGSRLFRTLPCWSRRRCSLLAIFAQADRWGRKVTPHAGKGERADGDRPRERMQSLLDRSSAQVDQQSAREQVLEELVPLLEAGLSP